MGHTSGPRRARARSLAGLREGQGSAERSRVVYNLLRQNCPGFPGAAFVHRPGRQASVPALAAVSDCARSPLMRPSAVAERKNNAQKSVVCPASARCLSRVDCSLRQEGHPGRAETSFATSFWDPVPNHAAAQVLLPTGPTKVREELAGVPDPRGAPVPKESSVLAQVEVAAGR